MALKSTQHTLRRCMRKLIRQKKLSNVTIKDICETGFPYSDRSTAF